MPNDDRKEYNSEPRIYGARDPAMTEELDAVFGCLRAARRRYLLYYLSTSDDSVVAVEEAVAAVREYEAADNGSGELPPRQSVRTDLLHAHLPRLADVGVLDYDLRTGEIQFEGAGPTREWLERARQFELL